MFYAGATDKKGFGCIYASENGETWKLVFKETAKDSKERAYGFYGFAKANGTIVAVGGGDNISKAGNCRMLASKDGTTWEGSVVHPENGGAMACVAFGKDRFVCHGGEGPFAFFATSTDGKQWSDPNKDRLEKWQGWEKMIRKIAFGNDLFLGTGANRRVLTSTDGLTWKDHADPERTRHPFISLAFGNGIFVAGGMHGLRATTKDGEKWENVVQGEIGEHINEIIWTGKEFVALGIEVTYKSPDGLQWTKSTSNVRPNRGCFGAGVYLSTNLRGTDCYRSEDAIHWKPIPRLEECFFSGAFAYFE